MINNKRKLLLPLLRSSLGLQCVKIFYPLIPYSVSKKLILNFRAEGKIEIAKYFFDVFILDSQQFRIHIKFMTLMSISNGYRVDDFKEKYISSLESKNDEKIAKEIYDINRFNFLETKKDYNLNNFEIDIFQTAHQNFLRWCASEDKLLSVKKKFIEKSEGLVVSIPFHLFNIKPKDPELQKIVETCFRTIYKNLQDQEQDFIPFLQHDTNFNYFTPNQGITYHTSFRNGQFLQIKESPLQFSLNIDSSGYAGWISYNHDIKKSQDIVNSTIINEKDLAVYNQLTKNQQSKYLQNDVKESFPKDYIFLALQVTNDKVAELANIKTDDLLEFLIQNASKISHSIVIKRHPKDTSPRMTNLLKKVKNIKNLYLAEGNIHTLIKDSKACLTVNSGVGFEALMYHKHVISTGLSDYTIASQYITNKDELLECLTSPIKEANSEFIKKFLCFYSANYQYHYQEHDKIIARVNSYLKMIMK